ncbi:hypothetical protein SteCoe_10934 [Stentor coeruleus]|uniref:Methyltransferase type 11 domain-containing protein n=1 Tax=Stentor coeruleus TaxID=5963 RepID=A0A1R2CEA2_9CILI|nr:hypothetical protein SteCoe_10934 [Stentor coeruleus]
MSSRIDQLKAFWDNFSQVYYETMESITSQIFNGILPLIRIENAKNILEVACGPGNGVEIMCSKKPENAKITACDFSDGMLEIARNRGLRDSEFFLANNEELPFDDCAFDRYVANMSLHIVDHPDKMIKEAFRVLQKGGIAVFSSIGIPGPGNFVMMIGDSMVEAGVPKSPDSPFDMNNDEMVRKMAKEAGFSKVLTFHSSAFIPAVNPEEVYRLIERSSLFDRAKKVSPEAHTRSIEIFINRASQVLDSGRLLTSEYLVTVAFKD